jgi:hypothetical protein
MVMVEIGFPDSPDRANCWAVGANGGVWNEAANFAAFGAYLAGMLDHSKMGQASRPQVAPGEQSLAEFVETSPRPITERIACHRRWAPMDASFLPVPCPEHRLGLKSSANTACC